MYDVRNYGGSPTGLFDNTVAIQQALAAVGYKPGKLLFAGDETGSVFRIDGDVTIPPNVLLEFDGACLSLGPDASVPLQCEQDVDIGWFGANGTPAQTTGTISAGEYALTVANAARFYIGSPVVVFGAGEAGGLFFARVLANNGSVLMLDKPAVTSVVSAQTKSADCTALREAMRCRPEPGYFYSVRIPQGVYQIFRRIDVPVWTALKGAGSHSSSSRLIQDGAITDEPILRMLTGGVLLDNLAIIALGSGKCVDTDPGHNINDCCFSNLWLIGNTTRGAMLSGRNHNLTMTNVALELGYDAIRLEGNRYVSVTGAIFYDIRHRMITSVDAGMGLNLSNVHLESVQAVAGAVAIELDGFEKINFSNINLFGLSGAVFSEGFRLTDCDGVRANNVQFKDFVEAQSNRVVLSNCQDVDWND